MLHASLELVHVLERNKVKTKITIKQLGRKIGINNSNECLQQNHNCNKTVIINNKANNHTSNSDKSKKGFLQKVQKRLSTLKYNLA